MYFSKGLLQALYNTEESLDEQYAKYILGCVEIAEEALVAFDSQQLEADLTFEEERANLTVEMEDDDADLEFALESIDILRENEAFDLIYTDLLDELNDKIVEQVVKSDAKARERMSAYLNAEEQGLTSAYTNLFLAPDAEEQDDKITSEKIRKIDEEVLQIMNSTPAQAAPAI